MVGDGDIVQFVPAVLGGNGDGEDALFLCPGALYGGAVSVVILNSDAGDAVAGAVAAVFAEIQLPVAALAVQCGAVMQGAQRFHQQRGAVEPIRVVQGEVNEPQQPGHVVGALAEGFQVVDAQHLLRCFHGQVGQLQTGDLIELLVVTVKVAHQCQHECAGAELLPYQTATRRAAKQLQVFDRLVDDHAVGLCIGVELHGAARAKSGVSGIAAVRDRVQKMNNGGSVAQIVGARIIEPLGQVADLRQEGNTVCRSRCGIEIKFIGTYLCPGALHCGRKEQRGAVLRQGDRV